MAPDFRRKQSGDRDDTSRPVLITGARESYRDELAARKKRYFILMSVRIPALLLAAGSLALWNNPWIALAIVAGSIPIPWIAVIGANDRPPLPKGQPRVYTAGRLSASPRVALPPGITGGPSSREYAAQEEERQRNGDAPQAHHTDVPDGGNSDGNGGSADDDNDADADADADSVQPQTDAGASPATDADTNESDTRP